jgi:hypothetical protein
MKISALVKVTGTVAIGFALLFGLGRPLNAQQQAQLKSSSQQSGQPAAAAITPKGCASGKMRCLTNDVRWKAAIAAADRRAAYAKKHGGNVK